MDSMYFTTNLIGPFQESLDSEKKVRHKFYSVENKII